MYAQLGDIIFSGLLGPSKFEDTFVTDFAEHGLVESKPRLEAIGEKLQEITLSVHLHRAFITPELFFDKVNNHRLKRTILPLLWGSGDIEGDFVIKSIQRKIVQQTDDGAITEMDLEIILSEYFDPDKVGTQRKRAQQEAFATNLANPLPEGSILPPASPGADAIKDVNNADVASNNFSSILDNSVAKANSYSTQITQAQYFVDTIATVESRILQSIGAAQNLIGALQIKMTANPILATIAPALNAQLTLALSAINAANTVVGGYSSMPNPVTTLPQALAVLTIMSDTTNATANLVTAMKEVKKANQPLVAAVITRSTLL